MSNKKNKAKRKKGLQKKNRKKISNNTIKVSKVIEHPSKVVEKSKEISLPSVPILGTPGIRPIPDVGMNHNVMKQPKYPISKKKEKNDKKWNRLVLPILFTIVIFLLLYYVLFPKNKGKEILLTCTLTEYDREEKIDNVSVLRYLFYKGTIVRSMDEESVVFSDESIKQYPYFEKSLQEWVEEEKDIYDNVNIEIKKTEDTIKVIYVIDLTADPNNPKNDLSELGYNYKQLKKELEEEGYRCK